MDRCICLHCPKYVTLETASQLVDQHRLYVLVTPLSDRYTIDNVPYIDTLYVRILNTQKTIQLLHSLFPIVDFCQLVLQRCDLAVDSHPFLRRPHFGECPTPGPIAIQSQ